MRAQGDAVSQKLAFLMHLLAGHRQQQHGQGQTEDDPVQTVHRHIGIHIAGKNPVCRQNHQRQRRKPDRQRHPRQAVAQQGQRNHRGQQGQRLRHLQGQPDRGQSQQTEAQRRPGILTQTAIGPAGHHRPGSGRSAPESPAQSPSASASDTCRVSRSSCGRPVSGIYPPLWASSTKIQQVAAGATSAASTKRP